MNASELRDYEPVMEDLEKIRESRRDVFVLLDGVQDTYNIGSFFRLADSVGCRRLILTGESECPPNHRIDKASVGTEKILDWVYYESAVGAIEELRREVDGLKVVAIEQSEDSVMIDEVELDLPLLLVMGHETSGVRQKVLDVCDLVVELPMRGVNMSMNVLVSAAMVLGRLI